MEPASSMPRARRCVASVVMTFCALVAVPDGASAQSSQSASTTLRASLPADDNLQWLNFWVAHGAGLFADESLTVDIVVPAERGGDNAPFAVDALVAGAADVAVLPRPVFLAAVAERRPVLAVANLLRHDPINLVVHGDIAEQRGLGPDLPLAERLNRLQGLRIGVAPGPLPRLRVLFAQGGLDADRDIEMTIVPGAAQNEYFGGRQIDALYAHTPYLETALVEQAGVLIVNQSAGEVAELTDRQIHMLVTTRAFATAHPDVLERAVRAIYRAQQLIHADQRATVGALRASAVVLRAPEGLETLVGLYAPAVPVTPEVSAEGALRELALYPSRRQLPDLSGVDMNEFVDNRFAERVLATP